MSETKAKGGFVSPQTIILGDGSHEGFTPFSEGKEYLSPMTIPLSRGYAETTPLSIHEQAFKVRQVIEKKLLREQIEAIILDSCFVGKDGINCDKAVGMLVEMMEGK